MPYIDVHTSISSPFCLLSHMACQLRLKRRGVARSRPHLRSSEAVGNRRMASWRLPSLPLPFSCRSCFQRRHETVSTCKRGRKPLSTSHLKCRALASVARRSSAPQLAAALVSALPFSLQVLLTPLGGYSQTHLPRNHHSEADLPYQQGCHVMCLPESAGIAGDRHGIAGAQLT